MVDEVSDDLFSLILFSKKALMKVNSQKISIKQERNVRLCPENRVVRTATGAMPRLNALLCLAFGFTFLVGTDGNSSNAEYECLVDVLVTHENWDQNIEMLIKFAEENDYLLAVSFDAITYFNLGVDRVSNKSHAQMYRSDGVEVSKGYNPENAHFTKFPHGSKAFIHFIDKKDDSPPDTNSRGTVMFTKNNCMKDTFSYTFPRGTAFDWNKAFVESDGNDLIVVHQDGVTAFRVTDSPKKVIPIEKGKYKPKCVPQNGEHCVYNPYIGKAESRETAIISAFCNFYVAKRDSKLYIGDGKKEVCVKEVPKQAPSSTGNMMHYIYVEPRDLSNCVGTTMPNPAPPPPACQASPETNSIKPKSLPTKEDTAPGSGPVQPNVNTTTKSNTASSIFLSSKQLATLVLCAIGGIYLKTMVV
uniref:DOMON domain-containing protein n=1 Tax=Panagrellus redivivus TaxID=6233 RepID=A0A7E4VBU1_PANRE